MVGSIGVAEGNELGATGGVYDEEPGGENAIESG